MLEPTLKPTLEPTLEQSIAEKITALEKELVFNRKNEIIETLIKEKPSRMAQIIFLINNGLLGLSLGKILSHCLIESVHISFFSMIVYVLISLASLRYLRNYWNKDNCKVTIKKEVSAIRTLKGLKQYLSVLPYKFEHNFLFLNNEKLQPMLEDNKFIENKDIKEFINTLNKEQLSFIMEVLKKHTLEDGFTVEVVEDIKKLCSVKKKERFKEEKLLNNLKQLSTIEEDDLLLAMSEEYIPKEAIKEDKKMNFKKIL